MHRSGKISQHVGNDFSERPEPADGRCRAERAGAPNPQFARRAKLVLPPHRVGAIAPGRKLFQTPTTIARKSGLARKRAFAIPPRTTRERARIRHARSSDGLLAGSFAIRSTLKRSAGRVLLHGRSACSCCGYTRNAENRRGQRSLAGCALSSPAPLSAFEISHGRCLYSPLRAALALCDQGSFGSALLGTHCSHPRT